MFKAVLCYSSFVSLKEQIMAWRIRRRDFVDFTANRYLEEFFDSDFFATDGIDFELFECIIGKEKLRSVQFIPILLGWRRKFNQEMERENHECTN